MGEPHIPGLTAAFILLAFALGRAMLDARGSRQALATVSRKLNRQSAMLRKAERLAHMGWWHFDPQTGDEDWSREMCRIHGLYCTGTPDEAVRRSLQADEGAYLDRNLREHWAVREKYGIEYEITRPDGQLRLIRMNAQNSFDDSGRLCEINAVITDVTEEYQRAQQVALEKSEALKQAAEAKELAMTDPLTGLANRRKIMAEVDLAIMRCRQNGDALSLITFDLDHFKQINDTYGHQAGDDMLLRVAEIAQRQTRETDVVGRVGGEEFLWLLPAAGPVIARRAAERLRRAIETESALARVPAITTSVGFAIWEPGDTSLTLFARADEALYAAKDAGRNLVRKAA